MVKIWSHCSYSFQALLLGQRIWRHENDVENDVENNNEKDNENDNNCCFFVFPEFYSYD